ncbi:MAG: protein phosphatase 2C domain-containing protein [Deltaproteobacteria bacterium]|nr:protein phosphatase 2C domain-containing protein [Deltaproteobacteria bacterium]
MNDFNLNKLPKHKSLYEFLIVLCSSLDGFSNDKNLNGLIDKYNNKFSLYFSNAPDYKSVFSAIRDDVICKFIVNLCYSYIIVNRTVNYVSSHNKLDSLGSITAYDIDEYKAIITDLFSFQDINELYFSQNININLNTCAKSLYSYIFTNNNKSPGLVTTYGIETSQPLNSSLYSEDSPQPPQTECSVVLADNTGSTNKPTDMCSTDATAEIVNSGEPQTNSQPEGGPQQKDDPLELQSSIENSIAASSLDTLVLNENTAFTNKPPDMCSTDATFENVDSGEPQTNSQPDDGPQQNDDSLELQSPIENSITAEPQTRFQSEDGSKLEDDYLVVQPPIENSVTTPNQDTVVVKLTEDHREVESDSHELSAQNSSPTKTIINLPEEASESTQHEPPPTILLTVDPIDTGNYRKISDVFKLNLDNLPAMVGKCNKFFSYTLDFGCGPALFGRIIKAEAKSFAKLSFLEIKETSSNDTDSASQKNNEKTFVLTGVPSSGFDGKIYFELLVKNVKNGEIRPIGSDVEFSKEIYIADDPKNLWNKLDANFDEGYRNEDVDSKFQDIPSMGKIVVAASCRGRSHFHTGKPRDDYFDFKCDPESGWYIFTVADGAGSARFSRKGSEIACKTVIEELSKYLYTDFNRPEILENLNQIYKKHHYNKTININEISEDLPLCNMISQVVYKVWKQINDEAEKKASSMPNDKISIRDFHTTLLFVALKKFDSFYFILSFQVGDGAIVAYNVDENNGLRVLCTPDIGEYAGQTKFITMNEEIIKIYDKKSNSTNFTFVKDFDALILATDGIIDPFFPSEDDVQDPLRWKNFWTKILKEGDDENPGCPELFDDRASGDLKKETLLEWLNFWSKGNHDDRTILIVKNKNEK